MAMNEQRGRFLGLIWAASICAGGVLFGATFADDANKKKIKYPSHPSAKDVKVVPDAWKTSPRAPLRDGEIDQLLASVNPKQEPSPRTSDEAFLRRVCLDVTGKLPSPSEIDAFVADQSTDKRRIVIDRLLGSDDFARHWGRYFRDVLLWRATDLRIVLRLPRTVALELWLIEQLKQNRSWSAISRDLLTASGSIHMRDRSKGGENGFLLAHTGDDATVERAADTSRIFLGIRIQCAQCHDHPDDIWERKQFHEFAAYFGRLGDESRRLERTETGGGGVIALASLKDDEYQMPGLDDPKQMTTVHPVFLTGEKSETGLADRDRREALADLIASRDNYWFAAAFVNRVWGALMGQSFYQPVDNMGPLQEATYPEVLLRLADSFRATDHDIKAVFRAILNSDAYQRQFRLGSTIDQHVKFAGVYPAKLSGETLWQSLRNALGPFAIEEGGAMQEFRGGAGVTAGPFSQANPALVYLVKQMFDFDPSLKSDDVEGSVPQAMMLMNNKGLNEQIRAVGDTPLAGLLAEHKKDESAVTILYLKALGRKPSTRELETCAAHLTEVGKRGEAFEDILWTLVNSTEFQTKR